MKRLVNVSENEFSAKWPMENYIGWQPQYDIHCYVIRREVGIFYTRYLLRVEGKEENIQMYIEHLKYVGFKIK